MGKALYLSSQNIVDCYSVSPHGFFFLWFFSKLSLSILIMWGSTVAFITKHCELLQCFQHGFFSSFFCTFSFVPQLSTFFLFIFFFLKLLFFPAFLFFFFLFFFNFYFKKVWRNHCSPTLNALWITILIHNAFLFSFVIFYFFPSFPPFFHLIFFQNYFLFFSNFPLFFFFFSKIIFVDFTF